MRRTRGRHRPTRSTYTVAELRESLAGDVLVAVVESEHTTTTSLITAYNFALAAAASGRPVARA
ncbi:MULTISPECIES: hypothetical protein [Mycolicibacterium]|jgi:hypothetical protein|uniref:Uncharacterized protein n=3 Tax=Mycolicibacterium TaxID=1866885 RepID=A0AAE4VH23_MYCFO|nr:MULTISPECIES: hypothetical protein [Mycolicibacterium]KLI04549.1 hypothetical protein AA982_29650 [Mycolicibacterium senegalense]KLO53807.1 hypothetical protein ABW05_22280 [Mycolicibacterium senegalense]KMV16381.1 hypothetical protein ACT17_20685 [Mycolicibacterium conceptionense]MDV7194340.1 hypothetical protein [Mycolicibacterium fortuitum]MDV7294241.1 hypothetical protein [Mycolicibacterium fortuitum]